MPRQARILPPDGAYHIVGRGNNRQDIFLDDSDKDKYLELISRFKEDHPLSLFHYCLMTNHIHLLLETNNKTDLPTFMKRLNLAYFHHFKKKYGYAGHFWQDRFKSFLIEQDNYLLVCGKYIELNPVRAKMVDDPSEYAYSSYGFYVKGEKSDILEPNPLFLELSDNKGDRQNAYRDFVLPDEKIEKFKGPFWGSEKFVAKMKKRLEYKETSLRQGRKVSFRRIKAG